MAFSIKKPFSNRFALLAIAVILLISLCSVQQLVSAQNDSHTDWSTTEPTFSPKIDVPNWSLHAPSCTETTLPVMRDYITKNEKHCMVSTVVGLIDANSTVIQSHGYSTAYPINKSGNGSIVPVPNQPGALYITPAQGLGSNISYYRNLYSNLKFDYNFGSPEYVLEQVPDVRFQRQDGSLMQFNASTLSFSSNGRYFVIDALGNSFVKIDTLNLNIQPFADTLPQVDRHSLLDASAAIDDSGRFAAISYNAPGGWGDKFLKIIDTSDCSSLPQRGLYQTLNFTCKTKDWRNASKAKINGLQSIGNMQFANEHVIVFDAQISASSSSRYTRYSMVASGQQESLINYLAMGDSFISGEGAFSYREGTDTTRNQCHQSLFSYPYLLATSAGTFASLACSGAEITNINGSKDDLKTTGQLVGNVEPTDQEKNLSRTTYLPGVFAQSTFVKQLLPESVLLSVGGNDVGFKDIVISCVSPPKDIDLTCYDSFLEREAIVQDINDQFPGLKRLYKEIIDKNGVDRRLFVVGYPQVAKPGGDCATNVLLNNTEIKFSNDLITYLNSVIKKAADESGAYYVDVEHALDGHRLCEGANSTVAVNGFMMVRNNALPKAGWNEAYHPNQRGQQMLADAIASKTHNLTAPMPVPSADTVVIPVDARIPLLQNAPKGDAPDYKYDRRLIDTGDDFVVGDQHIEILLKQQEFLLKKTSEYNVVIKSTPINLGKFFTDENGDLRALITIPKGMPVGFHTLHVYGPDIFGNTLDMQDVVYVAASETDYDGDGVPNDLDPCAIYPEFVSDQDNDGIEDACDVKVGSASGSTNGDQPPGSSSGVLGFVSFVTNAISATVFGNPVIQNDDDTPLGTSDSGQVLAAENNPENVRTFSERSTPSDSKLNMFIVAYTMTLLIATYAFIRKWYSGSD